MSQKINFIFLFQEVVKYFYLSGIDEKITIGKIKIEFKNIAVYYNREKDYSKCEINKKINKLIEIIRLIISDYFDDIHFIVYFSEASHQFMCEYDGMSYWIESIISGAHKND